MGRGDPPARATTAPSEHVSTCFASPCVFPPFRFRSRIRERRITFHSSFSHFATLFSLDARTRRAQPPNRCPVVTNPPLPDPTSLAEPWLLERPLILRSPRALRPRPSAASSGLCTMHVCIEHTTQPHFAHAALKTPPLAPARGLPRSIGGRQAERKP